MGQYTFGRRLVSARAVAGVLICAGAAAALVATGTGAGGATAATSPAHPAAGPAPRALITAGRMRARMGAARRGTIVPATALFTARVFPGAATGFALTNDGNAQYPALTVDGGRTWRIAGPQVHVDAADGPEGVGFAGTAGPRTFFAYGSSVVDVTSDGGRTWWQAFLGEEVSAVSATPGGHLVAYVNQQTSQGDQAVTWQYVSRDGGRHWRYSTAFII